MKVACLWFSKPIPMHRLAECCLRLSPQIGFRHHQALFIEYGKCRQLYTEDGFLARLSVILRRLELQAQMGLGRDLTDSLAFAKYRTCSIDPLPLAALLDFVDPLNQDPAAQKSVLKMIEVFQDLGLSTLGEFQRIPRQELVSRFGPLSLLCHQRLQGENSVAWPHWQPQEIIQEKTQFPSFEFYGELEPLLFELKKHLDRIFQRLWSRALKVQSLQVRLHLEKNSFHPESSRNFQFDFLWPQGTTKGALAVIKERLAKDFEKHPISTPLEGLETRVLQTVPGSLGQRNFLHNRDEISEQLHSLLNQLLEAHGPHAIFHAELTEDRRPEKSWKKVAAQSQESQPNSRLQGQIPLRPTHLLRPEKVEITAGFLYLRKKAFKIHHWSETVERITGGWIETKSALTPSYDRNYYQIELETGTVVWVFQLPDRHFYLHGYFG